MHLPRIGLFSLLVLAALAAPVRAQSVDELLERIETQKDGVDPQIWKQLTSFGSEESLEAVQRGERPAPVRTRKDDEFEPLARELTATLIKLGVIDDTIH